jgi:hypothetical protein
MKTEQPKDVRIEDSTDYVECYCRFKNRRISVVYIKSTKDFQTMIKGYFGKGNIKGHFCRISNNRGVKKSTYQLSKESFTCLTIIQNELLHYLLNKTDYLK